MNLDIKSEKSGLVRSVTKQANGEFVSRNASFEDLQTIHHELGHIQYQQQYKHLPQVRSSQQSNKGWVIFSTNSSKSIHYRLDQVSSTTGAGSYSVPTAIQAFTPG